MCVCTGVRACVRVCVPEAHLRHMAGFSEQSAGRYVAAVRSACAYVLACECNKARRGRVPAVAHAADDDDADAAGATAFCVTDFGAEKAVSVQGLDAAGVGSKLQELIKAGDSMPR